MNAIRLETAQRFVLGRQGLWPGRRWEGRKGVDLAVRYAGSVQFDPLDVVGRSHDLALWGRIVRYRKEHLEEALYKTRTLFETGGNVQIRPIEELPYLRIVMERKIAEDRWRRFARAKAALLARVTRELESRGPLGPGDFEGPGEKRIHNYRAGKESGLALYFLWLKGDVMIAYRRRGEKVFDLTDRLLSRSIPEIPVTEAEEHLLLGTLRQLGLASTSEWLRHAWPRVGRPSLRSEWRDRTRRWMEQGVIQEIEVDGWKGRPVMLVEAAAQLETLRSSEVPPEWRPRSTTTDEEVVFLAPLEVVAGRDRAAQLFDFEYVWEVYKPASKRRWGYYTLPVLWGNRLCARIELRTDRTTQSLVVLGFWPEDPQTRRDPEFADALGRALVRLSDFHDVARIDTPGLGTPAMRRRVAAAVRRVRRQAGAAEA
ncbi:MAG TPA: crosslink repair DNA glycosylase YcaQ family protein [Thermoplasmata archaeon]|nr:crosslink repair DNA glycosylase YcaQ family protein [Thermoplasmata archaeon]